MWSAFSTVDEGPRATSAKLLGPPAGCLCAGWHRDGGKFRCGLGDAAAALGAVARALPAGHHAPCPDCRRPRKAASIRRAWVTARFLQCASCWREPGLTIDDFDLIESNEAFAAQALVVAQELGFDPDARANTDGGAIAHGHPVGATGAVLDGQGGAWAGNVLASGRALVAMCVGGGQGIALALEAP